MSNKNEEMKDQENYNLPKLLTIKDVQILFGFSRDKTSKLVHSHGFPKIIIGKQYRIPEDELRKWIKTYSYNTYKL